MSEEIAKLNAQTELRAHLLRSSQSTSDAGGGVGELPNVKTIAALLYEAANPTMKWSHLWPSHNHLHAAVRQRYIDAAARFEDACAALSNPAAADSNASAEAITDDQITYANELAEDRRREWADNARLREALQRIVAIDQHKIGMFDAQVFEGRCAYIARQALSPDPHASDCEKQGEPGLNWKLSDECKKQLAEIDDNLRNAALNAGNIVVGSPSDRTADVTEDDLVRVIKKANVDFGGWEPDLARALRDAFDMRRR